MKTLLLLWALLLQDDADRVLAKSRAARPSDDALSFYKLDWAKDLADAKARAAKEGRPIFFVAVTNISGPDTFYTGHC